MGFGKAYKQIYKVREFVILKRVARNHFEQKEIDEEQEIQFQFQFDSCLVSHSIPKDKLLKILEKEVKI